MTVFITFREMGLFSYLGVQSGPLSLLPHGSHRGIITSYYFVKSPKTTGLVTKLGEKNKTWHTDKQQKDAELYKESARKRSVACVHERGGRMRGCLRFGVIWRNLKDSFLWKRDHVKSFWRKRRAPYFVLRNNTEKYIWWESSLIYCLYLDSFLWITVFEAVVSLQCDCRDTNMYCDNIQVSFI